MMINDPTPREALSSEEREKRTEDIRTLMRTGEHECELATFLLEEMVAREQEHQEKLQKVEERLNSSVDYTIVQLKERHAEEIRKAKAEGWNTLIKYLVSYFVVSGTDGSRLQASNPFSGGDINISFPLAPSPPPQSVQIDTSCPACGKQGVMLGLGIHTCPSPPTQEAA